jgi:hypothetical protein
LSPWSWNWPSRKEQLRRLWDRTPSAIDEEASLVAEMRKIEQRKKDRDKRAADLHKVGSTIGGGWWLDSD